MNIYIPSRDRASVVFGRCKTIGYFGPSDRGRIHLVVPEDQVDQYRATATHAGVQVLGCPEEGIARTRRWIGEYAYQRGETRFMMLDDDLRFYIRRGPTTWKLRPATHREVSTMLAIVESRLDRYACVGISPREGNNRLGLAVLDTAKENARIIRALAFQTRAFLDCEHGRVDVMEDFDILLQLLRRGLPNCLLVYFAQDQNQTQSAGGCSVYRTHDLHAASAQKLCALHPDLVRLRTKMNKTGGDFGTRTEVTIAWKKAYEERIELCK